MTFKKAVSLMLVLCMMMSAVFITSISAAETECETLGVEVCYEQLGANYGLADNIQDGNILHCFCWRYTDITAMLPQIAKAGFTAVQVSPPQPTANSGSWWWFYQPLGFYIGSSELGNKQQLTTLCKEADKYGIKVVADIVANHLAGDHSNIQNDLRDGQYWHWDDYSADDGDRYRVTHGKIGMPDLNTEHSYVQNCVKKYVQELKSIGVDGVRWDAAKHIGLPSEGDNFWPTVTNGSGMWHYGEILNNPGISNDNPHALNVMKEYTTYMSVTDSTYGMDLRNSFNGGHAPSTYAYWEAKGLSADKLVYWGESHDTWSNNKDWGFSNEMSQNVIDRAYAVAASRDGATALYFSRPSTANKDDIRIGHKGSTHFTSAEVAAVNQLKNACVGERDYYVNSNNCAVVCRESGAVIVAGTGGDFSVSVENGGGLTKPGTYIDQVSGSTWTVTSSTISGKIGGSGIAVILNPKPAGPSASVSPDSQVYTTDTLTLTLSYANATSGQYSIDGGAYKSYSNGQKITIGSGVACGGTTSVSVKASNSSQTSSPKTYTYTKADPNAKGIYFDNSSMNWGEVYCYIYKDGNNEPAQWPGTKMTKQSSNLWFYEPPAGYSDCLVLFNDGGGNQVPSSGEPGFDYSGSPMIYKDSWQSYVPVTKPTQPTTQKTDPTEKPTVNTKPTTPTATDPVESKRYLYGDVDFDNKITVKDATLIQKYCASLESLTALQKTLARVTGKSGITVSDATAIQKMVGGIITSFTVGKWYTVSGSQPSVPQYTDPVETKPATKPTTAPTKPTTAPTKPTTPVASTKNTVYFKDTSRWGGVTAYVWSTSGGELKSWPGTQMTTVGGNVYKIELDKKYDMIIFSSNGSSQSADLKIPGNGQIFDYAANSWSSYSGSSGGNTSGSITIKFVDTNAWGSAKVICWNNGSNDRKEFNMQSIGNNTYSVSLPSSYDKLYFTNGNQKSQDFDFPKSGGTYTYNHGWS